MYKQANKTVDTLYVVSWTKSSEKAVLLMKIWTIADKYKDTCDNTITIITQSYN